MYAIIFDMDANYLSHQHKNISQINIHSDIRKFIESNGFSWQQGGVYFGDETVNAVKCVVVVQNLSKKYSWFRGCMIILIEYFKRCFLSIETKYLSLTNSL